MTSADTKLASLNDLTFDLGAHGISFPEKVLEWMNQCPDSKRAIQYIRLYMYLNSQTECQECHEPALRKDLRYDVWGPFADGTILICRDCFDYFQLPTLANPEPESIQWPSKFDIFGGVKITCSGIIVLKKNPSLVIGTVIDYNPKCHTGRATLAAFPNCGGELGSLSSDWLV